MRLFLLCFLAACGGPVDDSFPLNPADATTPPRDSSPSFPPPDANQADTGPVYNGGPLACGTCTCDGTLYACLEGTCVRPPSPSDASTDADADASDDADAKSDAMTCGNYAACLQIPVACLPKPTCDCITKETGFICMVTPNGNGFAVECP